MALETPWPGLVGSPDWLLTTSSLQALWTTCNIHLQLHSSAYVPLGMAFIIFVYLIPNDTSNLISGLCSSQKLFPIFFLPVCNRSLSWVLSLFHSLYLVCHIKIISFYGNFWGTQLETVLGKGPCLKDLCFSGAWYRSWPQDSLMFNNKCSMIEE